MIEKYKRKSHFKKYTQQQNIKYKRGVYFQLSFAMKLNMYMSQNNQIYPKQFEFRFGSIRNKPPINWFLNNFGLYSKTKGIKI